MTDVATRFWSKVNKNGPVPDYRPDLGPCWLWTAGTNGLTERNGYGRIWVVDRDVLAHRWSYEALVGPIPEGLELDHLCRVHLCVRPSHLEPVTTRVNNLRGTSVAAVNALKTHCPQGHELVLKPGYARRECPICVAEAKRKWDQAHHEDYAERRRALERARYRVKAPTPEGRAAFAAKTARHRRKKNAAHG